MLLYGSVNIFDSHIELGQACDLLRIPVREEHCVIVCPAMICKQYSGIIRFSSHNVMLYEREARVAGRLWPSWLIILDLVRPLRGAPNVPECDGFSWDGPSLTHDNHNHLNDIYFRLAANEWLTVDT